MNIPLPRRESPRVLTLDEAQDIAAAVLVDSYDVRRGDIESLAWFVTAMASDAVQELEDERKSHMVTSHQLDAVTVELDRLRVELAMHKLEAVGCGDWDANTIVASPRAQRLAGAR